jgi:hypothetical protein
MADPFLDALGVQDPSQSSSPPAAKPAKAASAPLPDVPYSDPTDAAIRTVYAEASQHPEERRWVAAVISNRAKAGKKGLDEVVKEPGQFEPWSTAEGRQRMASLDPNSDDYKQIKALVDPVLSGKEDPSGGATSFYAPGAQAALGRPKPDFDNGSGVDVGQTRFFGGKAQAPDDFLNAVGADKSKAEAASAEHVDLTGAGVVPYQGLEGKDTLTGPQTAAYKQMVKGGAYDPAQPGGSEKNPFFVQSGVAEKDVPAGAYYRARDGKLKRAPGGPSESSAIAGLEQGVGDVAATISHMAPGSDDSEIKNALLNAQDTYGAKYGGDLKSGAGRFTGQLVASAPLMAAAEVAAAPALARSGQVGEFLAGNAGKGLPAGVARFLTRGGSLAAHGAGQGAEAAGLTSSANEGTVGEQMAEGAAGGAVLGPLAPAAAGAGRWAGRTVRSLTEPLTQGGREKIVNRLVGSFGDLAPNDAELVPGSVPTLAEASGNAGLSAVERNARANPKVGQRFAERQAQNDTARAEFFDRLKGDDDSIQALKDARDAATSGARETALKAQTQPADVKPVLDTIDTILQGPEGKRSEVVKALTEIRANLHDAQGNPETSADMLYGVRKSIDDLLSPKASSEKSGAKLAASQLMDVKRGLDNAIQDVAPGFKEYLRSYSDLSKPIDEQQFLQSLRLTDKNQNLTLARVQSALDRIEQMKSKPGVNPAKSLSKDTLENLRGLRDDLKRAGNIDLGKARGSDTVQNLVTGNIASEANVPLALGAGALMHHPLVGPAVGVGKMFYGSKNDKVLDQLATRLLDPSTPAMRNVTPKKAPGAARKLLAPVMPAVGAAIANRLVPAR